MTINNWLEKLKNYWVNKDLEGVATLFSDDVVYFETPYVRLDSKKEIIREWQSVLSQDNISFKFTIFSETKDGSSVIWELSYDQHGATHEYRGTYLIKLNQDGKCTYFYQTCEERK